MDKFALVYEFNKESPLATYMASKEIDAKNYSKAIKLLESVIEKFPYYPTPYILLSIANAYEKKIDRAKEYLLHGTSLLKNNKTKEYYEDLIDKIVQQASGIQLNFEETVNDLLDESFIEPENYLETTDLNLIDKELDFEPKVVDNVEQPIITETLAEIYTSQGNYDEAIEIFEKLIKIKPEQAEKFEKKIIEINQIIENKKK